MKRYLIFFISAALLLGGCGRQSVSASLSESVPENAVSVMGRVSAVSGNDFTLALGEYASPQKSAAAGDEGSSAASGSDIGFDNSKAVRGSASEAEVNSAEAVSPMQPSGGEAPPEESAAAGVNAGANTEERAAKGESTRKFVETGEELHIRIPVGTPILYGSLTIDFSQIQADYIVSLTTLTNASGSTVVLSAEILST